VRGSGRVFRNLFEALDRGNDGEVAELGEAVLVHGHHEQFHSAAFDGEAAYNGSGQDLSVRACLVGDHRLGDESHVTTQDYARSFDLLVEDAHKAIQYITGTVHLLIKQIFTHFSQSPHQ
jgi:hypothetical protein